MTTGHRDSAVAPAGASAATDAARTPFDAGSEDPTAARGFFAALFDLLSTGAPERARFEALVSAAAALAPGGTAPESLWPAVTLLPFVGRPDVHMLLRPHFACDAAQRLGFSLAYEAVPSWDTYASLLASTGQLLDKLRPLGARDHIDVESFMHAALAAPARAKPRTVTKASRGARAELAGRDDDAETDRHAESEAEDDGESGAELES